MSRVPLAAGAAAGLAALLLSMSITLAHVS
jgi:hypothetical protein